MNLRELRKEKKLSQTALAEELGIKQTTYSDWETGKSTPSQKELEKLAKFFNVSFDVLFGREVNLPATVEKEIDFFWAGPGKFETSATLSEIEDGIRKDFEDVKLKFFAIGYKLHVIANTNRLKEAGYDNIVDYAQAVFEIGKSTTYNLLNVYDTFRDYNNPTQIQKEFKPYSYSQLSLMSNAWCRDGLPKYVKPSDKVEDIKRFMSIWNKSYRTRQCSPDGNNLKEVIRFDEEKKASIKRITEVRKGLDIAPGQIEIKEIEIEEIEVEPIEPEDVRVINTAIDNSETIVEPEETKPETREEKRESLPAPFIVKPERKTFSTPGRIENRILEFLSVFEYDIFSNDGKGVRREIFAHQLARSFIENWEEVFKTCDIELVKD